MPAGEETRTTTTMRDPKEQQQTKQQASKPAKRTNQRTSVGSHQRLVHDDVRGEPRSDVTSRLDDFDDPFGGFTRDFHHIE
jgi:hypothetical protein